MDAGDIVVVRGRGWRARWIRRLTRARGEERTRVTHVALAISKFDVIEATWRGVKVRPFRAGQAYREKSLDASARRQIVADACAFEGKPYGYGKLVLHALDGLLGGVTFFRRFAMLEGYPICNTLVAVPYANQGRTFGVDPRVATPDDIGDFIEEHPNFFSEVETPNDDYPRW